MILLIFIDTRVIDRGYDSSAPYVTSFERIQASLLSNIYFPFFHSSFPHFPISFLSEYQKWQVFLDVCHFLKIQFISFHQFYQLMEEGRLPVGVASMTGVLCLGIDKNNFSSVSLLLPSVYFYRFCNPRLRISRFVRLQGS